MRKLKVTALVWKEDNRYVSFCPQFDMSRDGRTKEEALQHLRSAVESYVENIDSSPMRVN